MENKTFTSLMNTLFEKADIKNIDEVFSLAAHIKRDFYLNAVEADVADSFEAYVRFWNTLDEERNLAAENRQPIRVFINSGGGDLAAAMCIIDVIQMSKTPVITIVTSAAYSAGFFIAIAGHKRIAYPNASYMFHEGSINGKLEFDAHKFRNFGDFYNAQLKVLKDYTLKQTNWDNDFYAKIQKDDFWFDANDAIKFGVADEIAKELL